MEIHITYTARRFFINELLKNHHIESLSYNIHGQYPLASGKI